MAFRNEVEDGMGHDGLAPPTRRERMAEERQEALERDAARYRWLRDHGHPDNHAYPYIGAECQNDWGKWYTDHASGERADGWIDDAMKKFPSGIHS
ncbi:MAG: hypothetical protein ACXWG8_07800 [Usitatibacter sp.]